MVVPEPDGSAFLGNRYYGPMLLFLADHDGCMTSELREVTGGRCRSDVLDGLEDADTIVRVKDGRTTRIHLTAKGRRMGRMLKEAKAIYDESVDTSRPLTYL